MPVSGSWTISSPLVLSPFSPPTPLPPIFGSAVDCDAEVFDQDYLLRVLARSYPADYIEGMKSKINGGYELLQASAKVMERVSIAIARLFCCAFVITAHGGAKATGTVEFYDGTAGPYTIRKGSIVRTQSGKEFVTVEDLAYNGGSRTVDIEAIAVGYEYNVTGEIVTSTGIVLEGDIDDIKTLIAFDASGLDVIDLDLKVRNLLPTLGGRAACLDGLGEDRGIKRQPLESDDAYRLRILETPNAVTPNAIQNGLDRILAPYGVGACLREVGTNLLPGIFYDAGSSTDSPQDPANNYAYDMEPDIRPEDRFKLYLDTLEYRGFMLIGVPYVVESEFGFLYDGEIGDSYPVFNAYDTTSQSAPNAAYDGFTLLNASLYKAIYDNVQEKKAGGVGHDLYIEKIGCF